MFQMVRTDQKTDFQFPFFKSEQSAVLQIDSPKSEKKDIDFFLSLFALSFFCFVLLFISLDTSSELNLMGYESSSNFSANQLASTASLAPLLKKSNKTKNLLKPKSVKETIEVKKITPKKINPLPTEKLVPVIATSIHAKPVKIAQPTNLERKAEYQPKRKKVLPKKEQIFLNASSPIVNQKRKEATTQKTSKENFTKKSVSKFSTKTKALVINNKITEDLLPTSYLYAKSKAQEEGKLLFIKFGAKWCLPCRQMDRTTFKDERVKNYMAENYIDVAVDVQDFDGYNLQSYFNVKMLPTLLIFSSNGKFVAQYAKFMNANSMLEVLEEHNKSKNKVLPVQDRITQESPAPAVKLAPQVTINKVTLKKSIEGNSISSLRSRARNWRYTHVNFSTQNISEGEISLIVREDISGKILTSLNIPWIEKLKDTGTTTTDFQLDIPHQKRKKKNGDYVLEIYHLYQGNLQLIEKTTLTKDGKIIF